MNVHIERASPADAGLLVSVQVASFHDDARLYPGVDPGGPPGYDSVERMLEKINEDECFKIIADGRIIGVITVYDYGDGHFHLDVLAIAPDYHNRGIGSQAMRFIEEAYPIAAKWTLDTPAYATRNQRFYEKFGYTRVSEWQEDGTGITLIAYEKIPSAPKP